MSQDASQSKSEIPVTRDMLDAAFLALQSWLLGNGRGVDLFAAIYRAMRRLEPTPESPAEVCVP